MKDEIINLIGILFLVLGLAAIINTIINSQAGIAPILWLSYICLILIAVGTLSKNSTLIASQICIIAIPYLLWNIDFFYHIINGNSLFGIVDYFFETGDIIGKVISSQHIFNVPLSLIALYLIGLKRTDFWKISIIQITAVFFITRLVTDYEKNVNCVYHNCARFDFGIWYPLEWFGAYILMILITSLILIKILKK